jgi:hypothetical protein
MPPANRYASRMAQETPTARASFIDTISRRAAIQGLVPPQLNNLADGMGDTALCLDIELCRRRRLGMEEQRPPRRRHHLRRWFDCLVLASLRTPG